MNFLSKLFCHKKANSKTSKHKFINDLSSVAMSFDKFIKTIYALRAEGGCPWDREQTPLSIRRDLIEETFEAVDAISSGEANHAREELGDVLLNVCMMMYMFEQEGSFSVASVIDEVTEKLIRRHPHVFAESAGAAVADGKAQTTEQVLNQWDKIKDVVENRASSDKCVLDEVPQSFPPLLRAYKMQKKASKKGFDWKEIEPVRQKIFEELAEAEEANKEFKTICEASENKIEPLTVSSTADADKAYLHLEEEIGDLLFATVNYARHLGVAPDVALHRTNQKFYNRFKFVEAEMKKHDIPMDSDHLQQADEFWEKAKSVL